MGKSGGFLTPKAIGNRIKSKGLQKLRWFCQMCEKQCRDENGFKCHLTSESHKRQMELFGQAPARVIEGYSVEFEQAFLEHLRRSHPSSRISANVVYNEFIGDKFHIHMNSTKWLTLTEFIKHLGREGKCKVDETPKGWFISYVNKDSMEEIEGQKKAKRERSELEEEERHQRALDEQIARAQAAAAAAGGGAGEGAALPGGSELRRDETGQPLGFALSGGRRLGGGDEEGGQQQAPQAQQQRSRPAAAFDEGGEDGGASGRGGSDIPPAKKSKLELLMEKDLAAKQMQAALDAARNKRAPWLAEGIVVKVMAPSLKAHGYYKAKGVVVKLAAGGSVGDVELLESGAVVRVDQSELETVVPQPGGNVMVVGGPYRGSRGTLVSIDTSRYQAEVRLRGGAADGRTAWLEYEDFSRWQGIFK